jgi:HlyD family secretion protein
MRFKFPYPISLITLSSALLLSCGESKEGIHPTYQALTESVYASLQIEPEGFYAAYAASPGILKEILVQEGDTVNEGQVIARIEADKADINRSDAAIQAQLAKENYKGQAAILSSLKDEIDAYRKQFTLDSLNYQRLKRLREKDIGSQNEFENAQLKYELTKNTLDRLQKNYQQKENELESNYQRAINALDQAEISLGDYSISSRLNGLVYSILKEEGELLSQMEAFAQLGSGDSFLIKMAIDEVDIARVAIGQTVYINLDAYDEQVFEARLTRINPLKDERTQTFEVEAQFISPPDKLYAGLSGEANIVIRQADRVLTIPLDHLTRDGTVITEDGEVSVRTGLKNLDKVEIISGLDTSMTIYRPE